MGRNIETYVGATNIISSLGFSTRENICNISDGVSGIRLYGANVLAAQIDRHRLKQAAADNSLQSYLTLEQLMILSVADVVEQSEIDLQSEQNLMIFSSTKGNVELLSQNNDLTDPRVYLGFTAQRVADYFNSPVRPIVISNACISGVSATIVASRLLRRGDYKNIVVVGCDMLTDFVVSGFTAFKSVSSHPCRPYDVQRDGLTLGEACASMLITSDRTLSSGVVVEGGAITNDANHISGPSRTGDGLAYAIEQAMSESNLSPADISFVNAHGTATLFNDEMEAKAINLSGLQSSPVTSLKSYFGHTLGAAGVVETIVCVEQLKKGVLFGTKGFESLGVTEPILVRADHMEMPMTRCVKTASGFGGCNAAVVLALEPHSTAINCPTSESCGEVATVTIASGAITVNGSVVLSSEDSFHEFIRNAFKAIDRPNMKFYKMDDLCKLGYLSTEYLLEGRSYEPSQVAIVLANRSSSLDTDVKHQAILDQHPEEGASPAVFVYTLPNVVLGEICIRHKIQGENTFFIDNEMPEEFIRKYAQMLLSGHVYKAVIWGWCEKIGEQYESQMTLIEK